MTSALRATTGARVMESKAFDSSTISMAVRITRPSHFTEVRFSDGKFL
ncbi:MAG: hypothetical protein ABJB66_00020 [Gemmatimonadaceae bacterium]